MIGEMLHLRTAAFQNDDLQTISSVQMHMRSGQHFSCIVMLRFDELLGELGLMMVINQRQGCHSGSVAGDIRFYRKIPDQIPNRFRTAAVSLFFDDPIKFLQEIAIEGNCGSDL